MTERDITRLPKWAQDKMARLDQENRQLRRELERERAEHNGQHEDTNLVLQGRIHHQDMNLPRDAAVHFYTNKPGEPRGNYNDFFEVRHNQGNLRTLQVNSYGGRILISANATNSFALTMEDR